MDENIQAKGVVTVIEFSHFFANEIKERVKNGERIKDFYKEYSYKKENFNNLILVNSLTQIANSFISSQAPLETFKYIAFSDTTGAVLSQDTSLQNEITRLEISNIYLDMKTGPVIVIELFVGTQDCNFTWQQLGLVQGGTRTVNTGTLFSKVNRVVEKNNLTTKTILWEISFN